MAFGKALHLQALSVEPIRVPVSAKVNGAYIDPSSMGVKFAFLIPGLDPISSDWQVGGWDVDQTVLPVIFKAVIDINAPSIGAGTYIIWLWLLGVENPVRQVGVLVIDP